MILHIFLFCYVIYYVRLEDGKSNIYVQGELFRVCKQLLLNIPKSKTFEYDGINSIDDDAEIYDSTEERVDFTITPEQEFRAHGSNLQVWYENDYDTRILYSTLSFPLLKRIVEAGDPIARKLFK